jgi:hypothetical protein
VTHYTYLWLREDGTPYYVGKGSGYRAYVKDKHRVLPPSKDRILVQEFPTAEDAFAAEVFLISYYGRADQGTGILRNMTDGGDNPPKFVGGKPRSASTKKKIAEKLKGRKLPEQTREKIRKSLSGRVITPEHRQKLRESALSRKRKPLTAEWRKNLSESVKKTLALRKK